MNECICVYGAQNASVCPSDEDSQTFYVNASNGDSFRLKGEELPRVLITYTEAISQSQCCYFTVKQLVYS